jgi:1-deoxy-D-xylulose-5-phosphate reductoisomerase
MAIDAGRAGGSMPTVLNAANEVAVEGFLNNRCSFLNIEEIVVQCLNKHDSISAPNLEEIQEIDGWARRIATEYMEKHALNI